MISYDPSISTVVTVALDKDGATDSSEAGDGGEWITNHELSAKHRVPESSQRRARQSGQLPYVDLGGGTYSYRKADVDKWLTGERGNRRERERPAKGRRSAVHTMSVLSSAIASEQGCTTQEAARQLLVDDADLRQRLVEEANESGQARGCRSREDLREKAAQYIETKRKPSICFNS